MILLLALIFFLLPSLAGAVNVPVPATDLGAFPTSCTDIGDTRQCYYYLSYSAAQYDSNAHRLILFGAGHAASARDAVLQFDGTHNWTEMYTPTLCSAMTSGNYEVNRGAWLSGASGSYPRPVATHSADLNIFFPDLNELVVMAQQNAMELGGALCTTVPVNNQGYGKIAHYNVQTNTWSWSTSTRVTYNHAAEYDPISKLGIVLGDQFYTYDATTKTLTSRIDYGAVYAKDENGNDIAFGAGSANNTMVYVPSPVDAFFFFNRGDHRVWKLTLNRSNYAASTLVRVASPTQGSYPTHLIEGEELPRFVYDPVTGFVCGALMNGVLSCYSPTGNYWQTFTITGLSGKAEGQFGTNYDVYNQRFLILAGTAASNLRTYEIKAADLDFSRRCAGAVRCISFENPSERGSLHWGNRVFYDTHLGDAETSTNKAPYIDCAQAASGSCSLRFDAPTGYDPALAGQWAANYSDDLSAQYGAGQTFYVQLRQRYTSGLLAVNGTFKMHWATTAGDKAGCTQSSTTNCQTSCTPIEIVLQQDSPVTRPFPQWYERCPPNIPLYTQISGDWELQNGLPTAPRCTYNNANNQIFTNCVQFRADDWMTFSYKVAVGQRGVGGTDTEGVGCEGDTSNTNPSCYYGSEITARVGYAGEATQQVMRYTGAISAGSVSDNLKFGKVWASLRSGGPVAPANSTMWLDDIIISTSPIDDPLAAASAPPTDTENPVIAVTSHSNNQQVSTSTVNMSGTCTDNVACTSGTWSNDRGGSGNLVVASGWTASNITLQPGDNLLTFIAYDAANNAGSTTITLNYVTPQPPQAGIKVGSGSGAQIGTGAGIKIGP